MLCSKLHCQKGLNLIPFSCKRVAGRTWRAFQQRGHSLPGAGSAPTSRRSPSSTFPPFPGSCPCCDGPARASAAVAMKDTQSRATIYCESDNEATTFCESDNDPPHRWDPRGGVLSSRERVLLAASGLVGVTRLRGSPSSTSQPFPRSCPCCQRERNLSELMTSDRKLQATREGSR